MKIGVVPPDYLGDSINALPLVHSCRQEHECYLLSNLAIPHSLSKEEASRIHWDLIISWNPCSQYKSKDYVIATYTGTKTVYRWLSTLKHLGISPLLKYDLCPEVEKERLAVICPKSRLSLKEWQGDYKGIIELLRRHGYEVVINTSGSLQELFDIINRASIVIGCDSGPIHVASALGAKAVGLYAPTNPSIVGPLNDRWIVNRYKSNINTITEQDIVHKVNACIADDMF